MEDPPIFRRCLPWLHTSDEEKNRQDVWSRVTGVQVSIKARDIESPETEEMSICSRFSRLPDPLALSASREPLPLDLSSL